MIYFTSDLHFFHTKVIAYDNRPFSSLEEMHEVIISNWNLTISKNDIVYVLGDIGLCGISRLKPIFDRLTGSIILIRGNHDLQNNFTIKRFLTAGICNIKDVMDINSFSLGGNRIVISHYPYNDFRFKQLSPVDCGDWLIHGHCHLNSPKIGDRMINVGCMHWDYFPVSQNQISEIINNEKTS